MTLGILDSDDTPLGVPYNVSASKSASHESFWTPLHIGLVTGAGLLLVCFAAVVCYRYNRGTRSGDNVNDNTNVHRDSSLPPNSNDSGTAQGNEESAEESTEGFACDREDTERTALLSNPRRQGDNIEMLDSLEDIKSMIYKGFSSINSLFGNIRGSNSNKNNSSSSSSSN
jgi:hypothetical protein